MEEVIINYDKKVMKLEQENKRLHSIIKEVREYIETCLVASLEENKE